MIAAPPEIDDWTHLGEQLYSCSKLPAEAAKSLESSGFKSVLTVMQTSDSKFSMEAEESIKAQNLEYAHCPIKPGAVLHEAEVEAALLALGKNPDGPALIQCQSGTRATAVGVIYLALKNKLNDAQLEELSNTSGLDALPPRDWVIKYIKTHRD
jgi:protein tyrosine phosphatase (PTP) superfamily phosphohydrolase (DUF442 family)